MQALYRNLLLPVVLLFAPSLVRADGPPPADFQPDPASVQRYGPGYRFPQAGWIVLHIEGQPYERGYQHGRLLAPEIAAHLRCFATVLNHKAAAESWPQTRRLVNALFVRNFAKEFLEEMKGIADGASAAGARLFDRPIDLVDIVALNCWAEVETLDGALEATPTGLEGVKFPQEQPRAMPKPRPEHCSAFAATGPATADGKIVFGHITMFSLYPANFYNVWIDIKPAKGQRVLMCAFPGAMQSAMDYYMNDAGLLIAETTIVQTRFNINGQSEASRIRQAIQYAKTIDEAVAILKKDNNGLYANEWLLGDINTNEIALFELGTEKSKLHRSSKKEWIGGTEGFYWGCNNAKDVELRLEALPSVEGKPANVVFRPSARDMAWQKIYHKHKGKMDVAFAREAFTTPPLAAFSSLDAKFTTTDLAKDMKSWALFGPPLGKTWHPTEEERKNYPEIKPLVSNPWTILHANPPKNLELAKDLKAVDLVGSTEPVPKNAQKTKRKRPPLLDVPAWHGTLLPKSDADIWLATAFADYERIVAREKSLGDDVELSAADRTELAVDLRAHRNSYLSAVRAGADAALVDIKSDMATDAWYRLASGKGVLLLHELRRFMGKSPFEEMMDAFGRKHAGKRVSTAEFKEHVGKAGGAAASAFVDAWVSKTGLPRFRLDSVAVSKKDDAAPKRVKGEIIREEQGLPLRFVDVTVETDAGEVTKAIEVKGDRTEFTIDVTSGSPRRVILEKYGSSLQSKAAEVTISSFMSDLGKTMIVYGTTDEEAANREAAEALQKALRRSGQNFTVPIKSDKDVSESDLQSNHLLLIGRPDTNALVARFGKGLPIHFGARSFVAGHKTYANAGSSVVAAEENPLARNCTIVVLAGLSAEAAANAPAAFMQSRHRSVAAVVFPHGETERPVLLSPPELVRELASPQGR